MRRVRRIAALLLLGAATALFSQEGCSAKGIVALKKEGWSIQDIRALCRPAAAQEQQTVQQAVATGMRCRTGAGVCNLALASPVPVGTECYCTNRFTGMRDPGTIVQ